MLDQYIAQGHFDALARFKIANPLELGPAGMSAATPAAAAPAAAAGSGLMARAKQFGQGQWGAAKELAGNLRQGLGGAPTAEAGAQARQLALGNLKTLAPSLLAGGALYMLHRHNQAKRDQMRQQQMMMGGGYPQM